MKMYEGNTKELLLTTARPTVISGYILGSEFEWQCEETGDLPR